MTRIYAYLHVHCIAKLQVYGHGCETISTHGYTEDAFKCSDASLHTIFCVHFNRELD